MDHHLPHPLPRAMMTRAAHLTPQHELTDSDRHFPDLTDREEAFVWALLANGGKLKAAAIKAGYAANSADVTASRVSRRPAVIRALTQAAATSLAGMVPQSLSTIAKLSLKASSEHVRLAASQDVLDRVGLAAPKQVRLGGTLSVVFDLGE